MTDINLLDTVKQGNGLQEFPHFFLSNFPSVVVTIWYGQSKLLGKPAKTTFIYKSM